MNNFVDPQEIGPLNYLALGDSYTIGQGVDEAVRWPNQLADKLIENGFDVDKVDIIAQTGWKTSNLLNAIENTELAEYKTWCPY